MATRQIVVPSGPASARARFEPSLVFKIERAGPSVQIGRPVAPSMPSDGLMTTVAGRPCAPGNSSRTASRVGSDHSSLKLRRQARKEPPS